MRMAADEHQPHRRRQRGKPQHGGERPRRADRGAGVEPSRDPRREPTKVADGDDGAGGGAQRAVEPAEPRAMSGHWESSISRPAWLTDRKSITNPAAIPKPSPISRSHGSVPSHLSA